MSPRCADSAMIASNLLSQRPPQSRNPGSQIAFRHLGVRWLRMEAALLPMACIARLRRKVA